MIFYTLELVCKRKLHPFSFHWTQTSWQPFRSHCGQALHSQFSFSSGSPFKVMRASSRVNLTEEKAQQKEKRNGKKLRKFHSNNNRAVNFCSDTSAKTLRLMTLTLWSLNRCSDMWLETLLTPRHSCTGRASVQLTELYRRDMWGWRLIIINI